MNAPLCPRNSIVAFRHERAMPKSPQGFALVVALLLLVALSMVGIAALRNVTLQEKMAGNLYFRTLAFQESEGAMRATVARMTKNVGPSASVAAAPDSTDADWRPRIATGSDRSFWTTASNWSGTSSRTAAGTSASGLTINSVTDDLDVGAENWGCQVNVNKAVGCNVRFTRMTTRALDPLTGASVITQQHWAFPADK